MAVAAGTQPPPEWYLARDGEQFGPLSDAELRKLVEFGHLKPTDLLWREGFPEWRSARILLDDKPNAPPPAEAAMPAAQPPAAAPTSTVAEHPAKSAPATQPAPVAVAPVAQPAPANVASDPRAAPASAPRAAVAAAAPNSQTAPGPQLQHQPHLHAPPQTVRHAAPYAPAPGGQAPLQHPQAQIQPRQMTPAPVGAQPMMAHPMSAPLPSHTLPSPGMAPGASGAPLRPMEMSRPAPAAPVAAATRAPIAAPVHRPGTELDDLDDDDDRESSRVVIWLKRIAVLLFFTITLAAAGWYAYPFRDRIKSWFSVNLMPISTLGGGSSSPITGFQPTPDATEAALQKSALWRALKRDFPEWYAERLKEAATLAAAQKGDAEIGRAMMQQIVALRRKHASDALAATTPKLSSVASAFADNLERLRQVSVEACHTFVSNGEVSADYLRLLSDPAHAAVLEKQLVAVFEAIADGRKVPRVYPQPRQADYNLLVTALEKRGWTEADMQLFSDSRRFGQAPPEKVCKMVTDWFRAQGDVQEPDALLRLLADALKPVVAG